MITISLQLPAGTCGQGIYQLLYTMTKNEYAALDKEVLTLTEGTLGVGSLISVKDADTYLLSAKMMWPSLSAIGQIRCAAEDIVEYAIGVGLITCEEDFAN